MRRRKVIPLIGEELLQVEIEGKTVPLYAWMAERLASVLEVPSSELPSPVSLNDVACQYLARNDSHRNSIYTRLSIIVDEANAYLRAPMALRQLAEITDFNLFLTTSFDSLMESALNEIRKKETQSLAYSPTDRQDLPARKDLTPPTVYHLFGISDVSPTYAVSREDLLEWIYAMESQPRPKNLFDDLRENYILILGAGFSDWLLWFLRLRVEKRLSESRDWFEYLADDRIAENPDLVFLRHFSKQTKRYEGGAVKFVDELWRRWTKSRPALLRVRAGATRARAAARRDLHQLRERRHRRGEEAQSRTRLGWARSLVRQGRAPGRRHIRAQDHKQYQAMLTFSSADLAKLRWQAGPILHQGMELRPRSCPGLPQKPGLYRSRRHRPD